MAIAKITRNITVTKAKVRMVDTIDETFATIDHTVLGRVPAGKELEYFKHVLDNSCQKVTDVEDLKTETVRCTMSLIDFYNAATKSAATESDSAETTPTTV